ncbi:hypothetical protein Lser_V15G46344 [Lactuca serriola]|uniref:Uncharacterized protein n=1 Tax=Lactuca sativa TaxID=4236 RepID=A0A9R1WSA5_LACSA|nr:hypothetical protein LSAT_V11C900506280 [Lactuca sativa]
MTQSHIAKKWSRKGKVLRAIIHRKLFSADEIDQNKVHNKGHHECIEEDEGKQSFVVGFLPTLVRVPSRGLKGLQKLGRVVSMRKDEGHEREDGRVELCKMRIIMGKRCRPLNVSGALHYDEDGILVPEDFLSPSH